MSLNATMKRSCGVFFAFTAWFAFLSGCQVRGHESAELVLRGSIAESSEVVELDPVFLARQKTVEQRYFGFEDEGEADFSEATEEHADIDLAAAATGLSQRGLERENEVSNNSYNRSQAALFGGVALDWPLDGKITSPFGIRKGRLHAGLDIKGGKGEPVYAAADGQVLFAKKRKAYGNVAVLGHDNDHQTLYAHLNAFGLREGQFVKKGQLVGYVGRTGRATGFHLHFETRVDGGVPQNPMKFLPEVVGKAIRVGMVSPNQFRTQGKWSN